jgi:hypothetical protein
VISSPAFQGGKSCPDDLMWLLGLLSQGTAQQSGKHEVRELELHHAGAREALEI